MIGHPLLFRLGKFIRYQVKSVGSHGLHSPFLYSLYQQVIKPARSSRIYKIEKLRKRLIKDSALVELIDFKDGSTSMKSIGSVAKGSLSTPKFSAFLHLLIPFLKGKSVLETGTCLGINSLYLAQSSAKVTTIEGSSVLASLARKNFDQFRSHTIRLVNGDLYEVFESEIAKNTPDIFFLDADHRSSAIAFCIDRILRFAPSTKCIIIHDIYWSKDMNEIWQQLVDDPRFSLSIDIFQAGLLFPKPDMEKQHFYVRF